jgi:hypothetical protein
MCTVTPTKVTGLYPSLMYKYWLSKLCNYIKVIFFVKNIVLFKEIKNPMI